MSKWVSIKFGMKFVLPKRLTRENRELLGRLGAAARQIQREVDAPGSVLADQHHLADALDAIESLANLSRRARAVSGKGKK
jgi:hypothetical protein